MGLPVLTKTRTILVHSLAVSEPDRAPLFLPEVDAGEEARRHAVTLDRDVWDDMGRPETITVTIEPGDSLND